MLAVILAGGIIDLDGTALLQLLLFFVALVMLRRLLFRPFLRLVEAREAAIGGARNEARDMERDAKEKAQRYEEMMAQVRVQAQEARERLRQEGLSLEKKVLDNVRREISEKAEAAEKDLAQQGSNLRKEMQAAVPQLSRQMAESVLGRSL